MDIEIQYIIRFSPVMLRLALDEEERMRAEEKKKLNWKLKQFIVVHKFPFNVILIP